MKTLAALLALCGVTFGGTVTTLHNGVSVFKDNAGNQIAITQFATPIAVPVATVQPGATFYQQGHDIASLVAEIKALRAEVAALKGGATAQALKPSILTAHCGKCHLGDSVKGNFRLTDSLSSGDRIKAIRAVVSGKMPQDVKDLHPNIRGELITALVGPPDAPAVKEEVQE